MDSVGALDEYVTSFVYPGAEMDGEIDTKVRVECGSEAALESSEVAFA